MPRSPDSIRARLDRSTRRGLLLGSGVMVVTVLVELIRAA
jgi:hypothetical protein